MRVLFVDTAKFGVWEARRERCFHIARAYGAQRAQARRSHCGAWEVMRPYLEAMTHNGWWSKEYGCIGSSAASECAAANETRRWVKAESAYSSAL